uniref:BACK domain-containing protein n=1 Tax=Mesocestoides corti TaxID=53468 RepID=A0A5K3FTZ7_MESCO
MMFRLSMESVGSIWSLANATMNYDLASACVPVITASFETICRRVDFFSSTEPHYLAMLLSRGCRLGEVDETLKLRAISSWLDAAPSAEDQKLRADVFERLLSTVDLKKVSREFVLDLSASGCVLSRSEECREHLTNAQSEAWKCFDAPTAVSLKPCADHITGGFTRRGNITDTIYALGRDRESSDVQVIVKLPPPQLQADRNVSVRVPYRDACAVAVFDDSIYMLGGSDDNRDATNQVDRINPLDGSVSSVPSMTLPRRRPSAAATDRHLLVFGGDNGLWLASCEAFDSITNQWTVLPDMPTPRSASAAVNVPDVGVVVVGGWDASMRFSNRAELLAGSVEGENDCSWTRLVSMLDARLCPAVAFFQGRVVVAGGNDYGSITFECLPLNPGGPHPGQWTRLATPQLLDAWPLSLAVFRERLLLAKADGEVWECFPAPGPSESPSAWGSSFDESSWRPLFKVENISKPKLLVLPQLS